jgi:hypothetical protein
MLGEVSAAYGDTVKDEQELLAHIADVVIDVYAVESGLARSEKLVQAKGQDAVQSTVALDISRVFASDAAERIAAGARQAERALGARGRTGAFADRLLPIGGFAGVDTVAARRRIAEAVVAAGRHPF